MKETLTILMVTIYLTSFSIASFAQDLNEKLVDAIRDKNKESIKELLVKGAEINQVSEVGFTPLILAVWVKDVGVVKLLIENGADVNQKGPDDWTALMFAAMRGDVESTKNLLNAKAEVNPKTTDGETPLQRATVLKYQEIIEILKKAGGK